MFFVLFFLGFFSGRLLRGKVRERRLAREDMREAKESQRQARGEKGVGALDASEASEALGVPLKLL